MKSCSDLPEPDYAAEAAWLEPVLTERIPLGGAMGISIGSLGADGIVLRAPLAPNVNDKGTAFGGALASLMILAGWSLPRLLLARMECRAELVIGRCEIRYLEPVAGDFEARCAWPRAAEVRAFAEALVPGARAKLDLAPEIHAGERVAARLQARYAALVRGPDA